MAPAAGAVVVEGPDAGRVLYTAGLALPEFQVVLGLDAATTLRLCYARAYRVIGPVTVTVVDVLSAERSAQKFLDKQFVLYCMASVL